MTAYNPAAPPTCRRRCAGTCLRRSRALFRRERRGRSASSRCTSVQRTRSSSAIFARRGSRKSPGECQSGSQTSKATAAALRRRSAPCLRGARPALLSVGFHARLRCMVVTAHHLTQQAPGGAIYSIARGPVVAAAGGDACWRHLLACLCRCAFAPAGCRAWVCASGGR